MSYKKQLQQLVKVMSRNGSQPNRSPEEFEVRIVEDSETFDSVALLRAMGYSMWGEVPERLTDGYDHPEKSKTFALFDRDVPIGTARLIKEETPQGLVLPAPIDAMWLMKIDGMWPHERVGKKASEMSMYTIHPDYRKASSQITRLLFEAAEEYAHQGGGTIIYGLMRDFVVRTVRSAGKTCEAVPEARLNLDEPEVRAYCANFANYFLTEPRPQLYVMHS